MGNSGNFVETTRLIWSNSSSPFQSFLRWSDWLYAQTGRTDAIALSRLMQLLFEFLTVEVKLPHQTVAEALWRDYQRGGRNDKPDFLREHLPANAPLPRRERTQTLKRQARHAATADLP